MRNFKGFCLEHILSLSYYIVPNVTTYLIWLYIAICWKSNGKYIFSLNSFIEMLPIFYSVMYLYLFWNFLISGKDAKRSILLKSEECQTEIEYAFYRENVAKKYAKFFQSTLHHNNGYFLQVWSVFNLAFVQCISGLLVSFHNKNISISF